MHHLQARLHLGTSLQIIASQADFKDLRAQLMACLEQQNSGITGDILDTHNGQILCSIRKRPMGA